jgi:hypothetical protein
MLSVVAQELLYNSLCGGFYLSPSFSDAVDGYHWVVQALSAGFHTKPRRRCRVAEEGLHL